MAILVSNDDGIAAAGILALVSALEELDEVWVVAPDRNQSAVSHALTLHRPLRIDAHGPRRFAVDGTPTDCVNLAVNVVLPERPRLVVSGINHGANLGDDVTYSGTVSAAMEATLLGLPAIAVSQVGTGDFDFSAAAAFIPRLANWVLSNGLPPDTLLNVNIPNRPQQELTGLAVTRQGKRRYSEAIVEKTDPRGRKYYWIGGGEPDFVAAEGTDFTAIHAGQISITPLHLDLTNHGSVGRLQEMQLGWP